MWAMHPQQDYSFENQVLISWSIPLWLRVAPVVFNPWSSPDTVHRAEQAHKAQEKAPGRGQQDEITWCGHNVQDYPLRLPVDSEVRGESARCGISTVCICWFILLSKRKVWKNRAKSRYELFGGERIRWGREKCTKVEINSLKTESWGEVFNVKALGVTTVGDRRKLEVMLYSCSGPCPALFRPSEFWRFSQRESRAVYEAEFCDISLPAS